MIKDGDKVLFSDKELACHCCGKIIFAEGFPDKLKELRLAFGLPMTSNSCCRCNVQNLAAGGNPHSFHLTLNPKYKTGGTCAIDIARRGGSYDCELIKTALELGWSVGIAKNFIHIDRRVDYTDFPQTVYTY